MARIYIRDFIIPLSFLTIPASKFYLILIKNGKFSTVIWKIWKNQGISEFIFCCNSDIKCQTAHVIKYSTYTETVTKNEIIFNCSHILNVIIKKVISTYTHNFYFIINLNLGNTARK